MNQRPLPYEIAGPKDIRSDRLLFWPNNPRLKISDLDEVRFTDEALLDERNQELIFRLLCKHELHSVDVLARSIRQSGFMREKAPIVFEVAGSSKYLVLEGNRRLAAIRTVLRENKRNVSKEVLRSLVEVPCWVFVHTSTEVPLAASISRMVAEAHIKGQKTHTKIQQAHMLYEAYMGFLMEDGVTGFSRRLGIIRTTAAFFDITPKELEQELSIVCLYKQLKSVGYQLDHSVRERLSWVHRNPSLFRAYFGYDPITLMLDEPGLERFYDLFIGDGCAVRNPQTFKSLLNVMKHGDLQLVEVLRHDPSQLDNLEDQVLEGKAEHKFLKQLQRLHRGLSSLKVHEYQGSREERTAIEGIRNIVVSKLGKLVSVGELQPSSRGHDAPKAVKGALRHQRIPKNIMEALMIPIDRLAMQIRRMCIGDRQTVWDQRDIAGDLLARWMIRTRGKPREKFSSRIGETVEYMVAEKQAQRCPGSQFRFWLLK